MRPSTLIDFLTIASVQERKGITFIPGNNDDVSLSYKDLYRKSLSVLKNLQDRNVRVGNELVFQIEDNETFVIVFWACLLGRIIPVPLSVDGQAETKLKVMKVWAALNSPVLISDKTNSDRLERFITSESGELGSNIFDSRAILVEDIMLDRGEGVVIEARPDDMAYIQFSSGSTGEPKGVVLTHHNLVANARDIASRSNISATDSALSWMPLTHDMGLICFHLTALISGIQQYLMPTSLFVRRPVLWIDKASAYGATLLYSPNFGYQYFLSALNSLSDQCSWDLSSVRLVYNGAEPISKMIIDRFMDSLRPYGLMANTMFPGYGLAEASVAVSLPMPGSPVKSFNLHRDFLNVGDRVKYLADPSGGDSVCFLGVGYPMDHCSVKIVGNDGNHLPEATVGHIIISGDNVTSGYYNNRGATRGLFAGKGWIKTGDLGFISEGQLVITGRLKNLIIINGQNYYPHDIERIIQEVEGLETGRVAACGIRSRDGAYEDLVIFILFKAVTADFVPFVRKVKQKVVSKLGIVVNAVIPVRRIPKTTSGKIRYFKLVEQFGAGEFSNALREINRLSAAYSESGQNSATRDRIRYILHEFIGYDPQLSESFIRAGLNSIQAMQTASKLSEAFQVPISTKDVFSHPTVETLSDYIESLGRNESTYDSNHIIPVQVKDYYKLSEIQRRFWLLEQYHPLSGAANIALAYSIHGSLDLNRAEKAFLDLVNRHETLRTVFLTVADEPVQRILDVEGLSLHISYTDLRESEQCDRRIQELMNTEAAKPFDLTVWPLFRIHFYQKSDNEFVFVIVINHIICDGWSIGVIFREIQEFYNSGTSNDRPDFSPLAIHYKDYVQWLDEALTAPNLLSHKQYWQADLENVVPLDLPFASIRPPVPTVDGRSINFIIPQQIARGLKRLSSENGLTLFMTLVTVFDILLYKYTGSSDITIGTDMTSRNHSSLENQIGCYLNMLAIRIVIDARETFLTLLQKAKHKILRAYEHQLYPFDWLVRELDGGRDKSRSPIFDVLLLVQNFDSYDSTIFGNETTAERVDIDINTCLLDLQVEFIEYRGDLRLSIRYNTDLFSETAIRGMERHFEHLVLGILDAPDKKISAYNILPDNEKFELLKIFNNTNTEYGNGVTVTDLFENEIEKISESPAVGFNGRNVSYRQLDCEANRIAHYLRNHAKIRPGDRIGLMMQRSDQTIISLLAVLKAGAAFIPIDPDFPLERIQYIVKDCTPKLIYTDRGSLTEVMAHSLGNVLLHEEVVRRSSEFPHSPPKKVHTPGDLAYIMYTSGSTGVPKGVMVTHESLYDYVCTFSSFFALSERDVVLQQSSLWFDTAMEEIFPILCERGRLVVLKDGGRNIDELIATGEIEGVTVLSTTPLVIKEINRNSENLKSLRILISGGDLLPSSYISNLFSRRLRIYNTYGPTEATVCATYHEVHALSDASIIGKPIANKKIHILNSDLQLVPVGCSGEICIEGRGLARGYVNDYDSTHARFIASPFNSESRLFRTGDCGRWLDDGSIEFLGRKDTQHKFRGYRVELKEIESVIRCLEMVDDVIVDIKNRNEEEYLVAYFIARDNVIPDWRKLHTVLPGYMIPASYVPLKQFPTTATGKIDRRALPFDPQLVNISSDENIVFTETEEILLGYWREVLENHDMGIYDNFFELGGNSIKATKIIARVRRQYETDISLRDFFARPSVHELSSLIVPAKFSLTPILTVREEACYDTSHGQQRFWVLDKFKENQIAYNLSWAFQVSGALDVRALEQAFATIIERHEILRTVFFEKEGVLKQKVNSIQEVAFRIAFTPDNDKASLEDVVKANMMECFNLAEGPLIRVKVLRLDIDNYLLLIATHHIVTDGWSMNLIIDELVVLYNAYKDGREITLLPLRLQYKDFAAWQNRLISNNKIRPFRDYWIEKFRDEIPVLDFPTDAPRQSVQSYNGDLVSLVLDSSVKEKLERLCSRENTTLFCLLLAAVKVLLFRYTSQTDIVIGTPIAGRPHIDLENQVGLYLNTLPLRTRFRAQDTFNELLLKVNDTLLEAFENQIYPFDRLVNELPIERDMSRSPLFDVMVGYQNIQQAYERLKDLNGIEVIPYHTNTVVTQFDLSLDFYEVNDVLRLDIQYNIDLFKASRIRRFADHYIALLDAIAINPSTQIDAITILKQDEREQLAAGCNSKVFSPQTQTIKTLFENQVKITPEKPAITYGSTTLTYEMLNERSNRLAHYLLNSYKIIPDELIGVSAERSLEMIIAILGIIKSGGAYVPIDSEYPEARLKEIIRDSGVRILLTTGNEPLNLSRQNIEILRFNDLLDEINSRPCHNPDSEVAPNNLVYVIYTSASTGVAKGVMVEHKNAVSVATSWNEEYRLNSFDVTLLQVASFSFDVFFGDLCRSLLTGGHMVICSSDVRTDLAGLYSLMTSHKINILESTPGLIIPLTRYVEEHGLDFSFVKLLILGSDVCSAEDYRKVVGLFGKHTRIINSYGTTETTIDSSYFESRVDELAGRTNVPIGRPLRNTSFYILDPSGNIVPIGIAGELYIGGEGVSRGYLNNPTLTSERFIKDPFREGGMMYKTGDVARWDEDGNVEYLGRNDFQVKIRGYRIEPGEIENVLLQYPGVSQSMVVAHTGSSGEAYLVGYITGQDGLPISSIREFLFSRLPGYMVPGYFVQVKEMPLTPNGKIDRKSLPLPEMKGIDDGSYWGPRDRIEEALEKIWCEVLGVERVSILDNFFEIGGHSLKAIQVVSRIYKDLQSQLSLREIFTYPTISDLSDVIRLGEVSMYEGIAVVDNSDYYKLSHAQRRLWVLSQFEGSQTAYNMPGGYILEGSLHKGALEASIISLVERHEILRTVFITIEGEPRQQVKDVDTIGIRVEYIDLNRNEDKDERLKELIDENVTHRFDLVNGPLFTVQLIGYEEGRHILLFNIHHIISDGWSVEVLIDELVRLYNAYRKGEKNPLSPLRIQYKDYSSWQERMLSGDEMEAHRRYWVDQFIEAPPVLELPCDSSRSASRGFVGKVKEGVLSKDIFERLGTINRSQGSSLFMSLLASVQGLLYRYTGQTDMVIGSPIAGRDHWELEDQIGFYVNTLAIRTRLSGDDSFSTLVNKVRENTLNAYGHQMYPFDRLVEDLKIQRDMSRSPLFDVMVVLQNTGVGGKGLSEMEGVRIRPYEVDLRMSKYDLVFNFEERDDDTVYFNVEYNTDLFSDTRIDRMMRHYVNMISQLTVDASQCLDNVDYLSEEEKHELLYSFNNTSVEYPRNITVHELFERQVERTPDRIAVTAGDTSLTYSELNARANQVAHHLRSQFNVSPNDLIGLMLNRSEKMMIALLGILKSGAAYVPVDPVYPQERKSYIMNDAGIKALIVDGAETGVFGGVPTIDIDSIKTLKRSTPNPTIVNSSHDAIYAIYTSGTSGNPKGTIISHQSIVNLSFWLYDVIYKAHSVPLTALLTASINFDASVQQLFAPLLNGSSLLIIQEETRKDPALYTEAMIRNRVNVIDITPSYLNAVLSAPRTENVSSHYLRYTLVGGEPLSPETSKAYTRIFQKSNLINVYGVTEAAVNSTYDIINTFRSANTAIGIPLHNTRLYIVDNNFNLLPIGIAGELYIGGEGVSRGYLNNPTLTSERFIKDPFREGGMMYKTGDVARWDEDGNVEYLGRNDFQVKIRGYRIEPGEIENVLLQYPGVSQSMVVAHTGSSGEAYLVGYITGQDGLPISSIREFLFSRLPGYMVPGYFVQVKEMPLTPNGKIDRKSLPLPEMKGIDDGSYWGPRDRIEEALEKIWCEVLGVERVSILDNFFEIGGHSLKAIQVVSRIYKDLQSQLSLREIFTYPTISDLSDVIRLGEVSMYEGIAVVDNSDYYKLSHAQRRLWVLSQFEGSQTAYNMPGGYILEGSLHKGALEASIISLVERHEILRTVFITIEGEPRQQVKDVDTIGIRVEYIDLNRNEDKDERLKELIDENVTHRFDLVNGPLFTVQLIGYEEGRHILLFNIHHIISDGWSVEVLIDELVRLYNAYRKGEKNPLSPLRIQYKDYSSWQERMLSGDEMEAHRRYWVDQFIEAPPVLELPCDSSRSASRGFVGKVKEGVLSKDIFERLGTINRSQGSSLFMSLLASVQGLLYRYTGQTDMVIGSPIAGRDHWELEDQIGFYVNTLAIRTRLSGDDSFSTLVNKVRENTLNAYGHQMYPFDRLVEDLKIQRDMSRSPLFDVMVVLQNTGVGGKGLSEMEGVRIRPYEVDLRMSKYDLVFNFEERDDDTVYFNVEYNTDLFSDTRIDRMMRHYVNMISQLTVDASQCLDNVDYLSEEEKHELLYSFNNTSVEYPRNITVHELFERQVERTPDRIAVTAGDTSLTYSELNARANQVAHHLRERFNVRPNDLVALLADRSIANIAGILGILKSGAAFVPIDPEYPLNRIEFILEDTATKACLTTNAGIASLLQTSYGFIDMNDIDDGMPASNVDAQVSSNDLAYVIYTSGSTGQPKGVPIEHRSLINLCYWHRSEFFTEEESHATLYAGVGFDASVWEAWPYLLSGGRLYIPDKETRLSLNRLVDYLSENEITHCFLPTLVCEELCQADIRLRSDLIILTGGDNLRYRPTSFSVVNNYGPTESTVVTTSVRLKDGLVRIPIGKPISNTYVFIFDKAMNLLPVGIPGEIYISGDGLARGYLNRSELTADKFTANPYQHGSLLYKTGDVARWLSDGNIEFLGRTDDQIKIRGFRIELKEIENVLLTYPGIANALVTVSEMSGEKKIAAYFTENGESIKNGELRKYLADHLPAYMVPTYFIRLDQMPVSTNGKIDKKLLEDPESTNASIVEKVAPRNELEEKLMTIWGDVLGVNVKSIDEDFFGLGGHSLKATQVKFRIYKMLGVDVRLYDILSNPTIEALASIVGSTRKSQYERIEPVGKDQEFGVSHAQKRLWILDQFEENQIAYNIPGVFMFDGDLNVGIFEKTLATIFERHESLRTTFRLHKGEPIQVINSLEESNIRLQVIDLKSKPDSDVLAQLLINEDVNTGFNLEQGPLLRVKLFYLDDRRMLFLINIHHIVSDGWSVRILINEIVVLYNAFLANRNSPLQPLRIQYKDYTFWQVNKLKCDAIQSDRNYWLSKLDGEIPVLELPLDFARPKTKSFHGRNINDVLDENLSIGLYTISHSHRATLFMTLVAAVKTLLYKYTGQEDLIIGTSVTGRDHPDLENQVGFYVNTLALRTQLNGELSFNTLLDSVRESVTEAFEHQFYPYDCLIDDLNLTTNMSRSPLFEVKVILQNTSVNGIDFESESLKMGNVTVREMEVDFKGSIYELSFRFKESREKIDLYLEYNSDIFEPERMKRLVAHFKSLCASIIGDSSTPLADLEYISAEEKKSLLAKRKIKYGFNNNQ